MSTNGEETGPVAPGDVLVVPSAPPNLRRKLVNVMAACGYIQKRGYNAFHKYHYATEADVAEKVRDAFIAEGLVLLPTVKGVQLRESDGKNKVTAVQMTFRLLDADSEETLEFDMHGEGQDVGDKGIFKAVTGAEKYALMKLLLIPTGDDPEAENGTPPKARGRGRRAETRPQETPPPAEAVPCITEAQLADIDTLLRDSGRSEAWVMKKLGYGKRLEDIHASDYGRVIEGITRAKGQ